MPLAPASLAQIFGTGNGVPPERRHQHRQQPNPGGPLRDPASISPSTGRADYNFDGAICQRNLLTGTDANAGRVQTGVARDAAHREPARQARDHRARPLRTR